MPTQIELYRNVALSILKPSDRDLEHGLELHATSAVVETYGFAPRGRIDCGKLRDAYDAGVGEHALEAMQEEMRLTSFLDDPVGRDTFKKAWKASGVTCIFQNAGQEGQTIGRLLRRLANFTHITDVMQDKIRRVVCADDIIQAKKDGVSALCLTGNGVPLSEHWDTVCDELDYIHTFFQLGVRMMHLTYNRRNMLGEGCGESDDAGLSDLGRKAIAEMNRVGVIVDIAHSGWRTSREAAEVSEAPIVASHTVCHAVHEHIRSKPDDVIRAIVDKNGLVGVCCIPAFLGGAGNISTFLDHIDHLAKTFGTDYIGIGTDVSFSPSDQLISPEKMPNLPAKKHFRSLWPESSELYLSKWQKPEQKNSMAWTNWPLFTVGLVQRGYSDVDIRKIIGGNMLRVARAAMK